MNTFLAKKIIETVAGLGVKEVCLCSGARNAPFIFLLEKSLNVKIHSFFEERSASFFALGRILSSHAPVAVVTTSGTAAAELLPATIESYYQGLPLVLITADRPQRFRGSGAPQSIEQIGIFSHYTTHSVDIDQTQQNIDISTWEMKSPIHLNVCFEEPENRQEDEGVDFQKITQQKLSPPKKTQSETHHPDQPLVIAGTLKSKDLIDVKNYLTKIQCPIYAESTSLLSQFTELKNFLVTGGEKTVEKLLSDHLAQSIIRIGGIPTLRSWRDLEGRFLSTPVYSVSDLPFTGLSRPSQHYVGYDNLAAIQPKNKMNMESVKTISSLVKESAHQLLSSLPLSEANLVYQLSQKISSKNMVYCGNSLPIREWDLAHALADTYHLTFANRGANGIEGQISTFLGLCQESEESWCLLGDLTTLYDLSAPWICSALPTSKKRIVVINNQGGKIFKSMFSSHLFLNEHQISFLHWAKMWRWDYQLWREIPNDTSQLPENIVIELQPDLAQSDLFWQKYKLL